MCSCSHANPGDRQREVIHSSADFGNLIKAHGTCRWWAAAQRAVKSLAAMLALRSLVSAAAALSLFTSSVFAQVRLSLRPSGRSCAECSVSAVQTYPSRSCAWLAGPLNSLRWVPTSTCTRTFRSSICPSVADPAIQHERRGGLRCLTSLPSRGRMLQGLRDACESPPTTVRRVRACPALPSLQAGPHKQPLVRTVLTQSKRSCR